VGYSAGPLNNCLVLITCHCCLFVVVSVSFVSLVSSVLREEICWEECLQNDLFCVELDIKPCSISIPFNE